MPQYIFPIKISTTIYRISADLAPPFPFNTPSPGPQPPAPRGTPRGTPRRREKGIKTCTSGYQACWRWVWVPRGDISAPGRPAKGGPVVSGASVVEGEKGGGKGRGSRGADLGRQ